MTAHAHDSRVHFKLDEIDRRLRDLGVDIWEAQKAVARLIDRRQEIAADVAIIREMMGVR